MTNAPATAPALPFLRFCYLISCYETCKGDGFIYVERQTQGDADSFLNACGIYVWTDSESDNAPRSQHTPVAHALGNAAPFPTAAA